MSQGVDAEWQGEGGEGETPDIRGGGLKLHSLKAWRSRRDLTQTELARKADVEQRYLSRVERGERGCSLPAARRLAGALGVDLAELRVADPSEEERTPTSLKRGRRYLHQAYLGLLLNREVGSAYLLLDEEELERHCQALLWEGVLEVVSCRGREVEVLREMLQNADLHPEVRLFLEELLRRHPDEDIRLLAAARSREDSKDGREELTRAMRELL